MLALPAGEQKQELGGHKLTLKKSSANTQRRLAGKHNVHLPPGSSQVIDAEMAEDRWHMQRHTLKVSEK